MASAQASGGQITRKQQSPQSTTTPVKPRRNVQIIDQDDKKGLAELERIRKQGEVEEQNVQSELLRVNDNNRKLDILKSASSAFERNKDFERAIEFYNQYLKLLHRLSSDDLDSLAKLYSRFADFLSDYQLEEYRKDILLKAIEVYHQMGEIYPTQKAYAAYQAAVMHNKLDKTLENGLAKPDYLKVVSLLENKADRDWSENTMLKYSYHYLMTNAFLYGKNKALAKDYANKILAIDPEYAPAQQIRDLK